jgi:hypothetical protein
MEDAKTFRFRLNNVPQLKSFLPRPYVLLSGTYSKALETESWRLYSFEDLTCLRHPTSRQNLKLCVFDVARQEDSFGQVVTLLESFKEAVTRDKGQRCMVFVRTRKQAEIWSTEAKSAVNGVRTGKHQAKGSLPDFLQGLLPAISVLKSNQLN